MFRWKTGNVVRTGNGVPTVVQERVMIVEHNKELAANTLSDIERLITKYRYQIGEIPARVYMGVDVQQLLAGAWPLMVVSDGNGNVEFKTVFGIKIVDAADGHVGIGYSGFDLDLAKEG